MNPGLKLIETSEVTKTTSFEGVIPVEGLREVLGIPSNASIFVVTPGGGDWSSTQLEIGSHGHVQLQVRYDTVEKSGTLRCDGCGKFYEEDGDSFVGECASCSDNSDVELETFLFGAGSYFEVVAEKGSDPNEILQSAHTRQAFSDMVSRGRIIFKHEGSVAHARVKA